MVIIVANTSDEIKQAFEWLAKLADAFAEKPAEKKAKMCAPSKAFLDTKEFIRKDHTILKCEDNKKIYFIEKLPDSPGTYFFFDKSGIVLYVGSTRKLSQRIPQSFAERYGKGEINTIGFRTANSKEEAINLESFMINKYRPKLNIIIPPMPKINIDFDKLTGEEFEVKMWRETE